jgi:hypothetical protein
MVKYGVAAGESVYRAWNAKSAGYFALAKEE